MKRFTFILLILVSTYTFAQQLVYTPINPAFGGNPINYSWLLSSASAQNQFDETPKFDFERSILDEFENSVKRQFLNQFTNQLFGTDGNGTLEPGTYEGAGLIVNVEETSGGTIITIIDTTTGESTQIVV